MKPLTNEQIWGVPDEELPEDNKDYFDDANEEEIDQRHPRTAGPGGEDDS